MNSKIYNLTSLLHKGTSQSPEMGKKMFYIVIIVVFSSLIVDSIINYVADFIFDRIATFWGIALFVLFGGIYAAGQFFILKFVKQKTKDIRDRSLYLNLIHRVVTLVQYSFTAILLFVILQMTITQQYSLTNLILVSAISYSLNVALLLLFAERMFRWYRSNRELHSHVIIRYFWCGSCRSCSLGNNRRRT